MFLKRVFTEKLYLISNGLIFDGFQANIDAGFAKAEYEKLKALAETGIFAESPSASHPVQFSDFAPKMKEESLAIEKTLGFDEKINKSRMKEILDSVLKEKFMHNSNRDRKAIGNVCLAIFLTGISQIQQRVEHLWKIVADNYKVRLSENKAGPVCRRNR